MRALKLMILVTLLLMSMVQFSGSAQAFEGRIASLTLSTTLPILRPESPVPDEPGQVLYVQRSKDRNTLIVAAQYDADGNLLRDEPVALYWRRYEEEGQVRALSLRQRLLAPMRVRPLDIDGEFDIRFRTMAGSTVTLRQTGPFEAELIARVNDETVRLQYGFIHMIEGLIPKVEQVLLFGHHESGKIATVAISP